MRGALANASAGCQHVAFIDGVDVVCVLAAAGVSGGGGDHGIRPLHGGDEVRPHDHHTPDTQPVLVVGATGFLGARS
jgi:hypothetical protein